MSMPKMSETPAATHKVLKTEHLGNLAGRRTPGLTTVGGGDQLAHSLSHYGKDGPQILGDPWGVTGFPRPSRFPPGRR
jgi:hypothetical protein